MPKAQAHERSIHTDLILGKLKAVPGPGGVECRGSTVPCFQCAMPQGQGDLSLPGFADGGRATPRPNPVEYLHSISKSGAQVCRARTDFRVIVASATIEPEAARLGSPAG